MGIDLALLVRKIGLIKFADKLRFYFLYLRTYKLRKDFRKSNPKIVLPPPYYIYETFNLNYFSFYNKSVETAEWLVSYFEKYMSLRNLKILDWGCGPGRIIRHLPSFFDKSCEFFGTDYNKKYIKWCTKYITGVSFSRNHLQPPLQYSENTFDIIYGISIFTHLSKEMHFGWFKELIRVLKPGGILLLTLHGNAFLSKLTVSERKNFGDGELVTKSNTKEGHRTFGAFQPIQFVKQLVGDNEIMEFIEGDIKDGKPQQDLWIIKKSVDQ